MKKEEKITLGIIALLLMFRLKHILDPKNVLMSDNTPTPIPDPDPQQTPLTYILRSANTGGYDIKTSRVWSQLKCDYTNSAGESKNAYTTIEDVTIDVLANTNIYVYNDNNFNPWSSYIDKNTDRIVLCSRLVGVYPISDNPDRINYVDMRTVENLNTFDIRTPNLTYLYAKATTETLKNISLGMLNDSVVRNGVVYVKSDEAYIADVIAAAQAKGWRVYYL